MAVGSVTYASMHTVREWQKYGGMAAGYRPGWVTGDPNYFSISALLCLPVAIYLLRTQQKQWERYFCLFSIAITLLGLTLAASRGGFVGLAAGSLVMALHTKRRLRTLAIVIAVTLPLMAIAPSSPLTRLFSPDHNDQYSADHRMDLAAAGLAMFQANLLTGVGPGNFKGVLGRYAALDEVHIAHNTYVQVMAEMGIFGIVLFLATVIATFFSLERTRRHAADELLRRTAEGLEVGLVGFLVAAFFVSADAHRFFWFVMFLTMVLATLASRTQERPLPASPRPRVRETVRQVS
jgi:putative inorganic carbon (hco3(-)) transporter